MPSPPLVLSYLFWELAVTALCFVALAGVRPLALKLSLLVGLNIAASALCATPLSFLHLNTSTAYLALAAVFSCLAVVTGRRRRDKLLQPFEWSARHRPDVYMIWFALGAMLVLSISPTENVDSLYNLHYAMGWVQNQSTPYQFAYNYVPFWELSYIPGLVLTHSDTVFWFNSLKPVVLLGLLLLLIARQLGLPGRLAIWAIPALLLFPHLWLGPSGVCSIKNDMIHAAGYAMAALVAARAARRECTAIDVVLAALAAAFVCVKFSGPVAMIVGGAVIALVAWRWIVRNLRTVMLATGVVAAFWFVTTGHYFLRNYLVYGNPVGEYQINLGPIHLPGRADLSATSILYSLHDVRLWRSFFLPEHGLSPAGILFPIVVPAILIGSAVLAGIALWRRRITALAALALFELGSWFVYLRSTYSASGWPGDMAFVVNDLNSVRYVEGPLLVGELCLVWALYRIRTPRALIYSLLAAQAASSIMVSLHRAPDKPWLLAVLCGLALVLSSLVMRRRILIPAAAVVMGFSLFVGEYLVERRRPLWLRPFQPLYQPLYEAKAQNLFYLMDDEYSQQPCWHFAFLGHRLQHDVASGSLNRLLALPTPPRYVAWTRVAPDVPPLSLPGYTAVVSVPKGMLFERR